MIAKKVEETRSLSSEPALRVIMRRLREIMADLGDGQSRLDKIVRQIAGVMVADVCSFYLKRQDGSLELFATEGLNPTAVHKTLLKRGEGLVGRCAELNITINEPEAPRHPAFSYRPETGEEVYHSLLAVPIKRSGQVLGVLVVQNRTSKEYSDEDVEVLETTAMVVAEHLVSGAVAGTSADLEISSSLAVLIKGQSISEGLALGHVVLHEPRIVITKLMSEDPAQELRKLENGLADLRVSLDEMLAHEHLSAGGEHRDVMEAYRMFAHDKGWERQLREAVQDGLTAEAAVERVHNHSRSRLLQNPDPFWRERQRDLEDLSDRLLRILAGRPARPIEPAEMAPDTVLVSRTMGPAELLDYDRSRLRGLVIEDGSPQSHVAIVAKALGIAAVARASGIVERASAGDSIIVDGITGQVHLRPQPEVISAYSDKARFRARRQKQYEALRGLPATTKDGEQIALQMNAGLVVDMPHLEESGADGIGLFRTELQFMLSRTLPRHERQVSTYKKVLDEAKNKPVVFRALDIGGDKILPYLRQIKEENPAIGWRAIRMTLDRPGLLRLQLRALLHASSGRDLRLMIPMVTEAQEIDLFRAQVEKELGIMVRKGIPAPRRLSLGAMIEVPSVLFELDSLLPKVDFVSVGSNDLLQFLFAADRTNARVGSRYDCLSIAPLRVLSELVKACAKHKTPLTLCGEMAGQPLESMALIALGFRTLSMAPASIGPVKTMILGLDLQKVRKIIDRFLRDGKGSIRSELLRFANESGLEI